MKKILFLLIGVVVSLFEAGATSIFKGTIYVHPEVTTHIVMPENIKFVDLSTELIIGNQCADNMVRIKPVVNSETQAQFDSIADGCLLATISVVGERNIAQFEIRYSFDPRGAESYHAITQDDLISYKNPSVTMPEGLMSKYAWAIYCSGRKFNNITSKKNGLHARVNNIYSVGDYFFIDFSIDNKTIIPYDIDEIRVKVDDKKQAKATNTQMVELTPVYQLNLAKKFWKGYRNVLVLEKLTFPNEKILTIELSEQQISGRTIALTMEYEDILNADGFDDDLIDQLDRNTKIHINQ